MKNQRTFKISRKSISWRFLNWIYYIVIALIELLVTLHWREKSEGGEILPSSRCEYYGLFLAAPFFFAVSLIASTLMVSIYLAGVAIGIGIVVFVFYQVCVFWRPIIIAILFVIVIIAIAYPLMILLPKLASWCALCRYSKSTAMRFIQWRTDCKERICPPVEIVD